MARLLSEPPTKFRSAKYREAAEGQPCTLNILGVCTYDTEAVVLAHLPGEYKGTGSKVCDLNGVDACDACHAVIDGRAHWPPLEKEYQEFYFRRALHRTLLNRVWQGVVTIPGEFL